MRSQVTPTFLISNNAFQKCDKAKKGNGNDHANCKYDP